jgi:hypothetical protein
MQTLVAALMRLPRAEQRRLVKLLSAELQKLEE